ncbi:MAG: hypothetical protein OHK0024_36730 [Thalassobaculales bacterium]
MLAVNQLAGFGAASSRIAPLDQAIAWTATTAGTATFARSLGDRRLRIHGAVSGPYCVSGSFAVDGAPRYLEMIVSATSYATDARFFQLGADESSGSTSDSGVTATYGWYYSGAAATDGQEILRHAAGPLGGHAGAALPVRLGLGMRRAAGAITFWQNGVLQYTLTGAGVATHLAGALKLRAGLNVGSVSRDVTIDILTPAEALHLPPGHGYV